MSDWKPEFKKPEDAARLRQMEESIRKIRGVLDINEAKVGKLTNDSVLKAQEIGFVLLKIRWLVPGQYGKWIAHRFKGSPETAKGYRKLTDPVVWEKVQRLLKSENGCTLKQALQLAVKEPQPKKKTRQQLLARKLGLKFAKMITGWPEAVLARLSSDIRFMKQIEEVARERNKLAIAAMKAQMLDAA